MRAVVVVLLCACSAEGSGDTVERGGTDSAALDSMTSDTAVADTGSAMEAAADTAPPPPTTLDLKDVTLFDNPMDLASWPVTTKITKVEFRKGDEGVHLEFDKLSTWPDITPPGWDGPLQYTVGLCEFIDGKWYGSAAIQYWRGLDASGGNVATDVATKAQCAMFGYGSGCQVGKNWYYDGRWGKLATYQPKTGELIGVFVVAGNVRGVTDGSQSPSRERSNVVLVKMPDVGGATYTF
jgi:hypothetical protein